MGTKLKKKTSQTCKIVMSGEISSHKHVPKQSAFI